LSTFAEIRTAPSRNFKITVAYDGRGLSGWQRQENGVTVQELLEEAVGKVCGHRVIVWGSGRTDAGVHATGQVASFNTSSSRTPSQIIFGSNSLLPANIAILKAEEAPPEFHARFSATGKKYTYDFLTTPIRHPHYAWKSWWVGARLRWDRVEECLPHLVGEKDFATFRSLGSQEKSTVRKIFRARLLSPEPELKRLELIGSGFLRHMARAIAGTVFEIGRGRVTPLDFPGLIASLNRALAGAAAPPQGLCLREVYYEPLELADFQE
jgi:tRNA pseudouridine38-40 synthase